MQGEDLAGARAIFKQHQGESGIISRDLLSDILGSLDPAYNKEQVDSLLSCAGYGDHAEIDIDGFFAWIESGKAKLVVGNTAARRDAETHDWTFYVRGATYFVEQVVVKLHPTFKNPVRKLRSAPFELSARGWGTFGLEVIVKWKGGGELMAEWDLQFDSPDANSQVEVPSEVAARALRPAAEAIAALQAADAAGESGSEADSGSDEDAKASKVMSSQSGEAIPLPVDDDSDESMPPVPMPELLRDVSAGSEDLAPPRVQICEQLRRVPFMEHTHELFKHGRGYTGPLKAPKVTWRSDKPPRKDHATPPWLTATEFQDLADVAASKVQHLAALMRLSRKTVAYTGAGISAAVIGQAALSGQNKVGWKDTTGAKPTFTHYALGFLGQQGFIHSWVQQNHDGLPQKAGFPQERINEIHGSWYDPSNPVVKYSGSLHARAYPWMREDAATADLVLVLGTSLGGLNADQVATNCAERSLLPPPPTAGAGMVAGGSLGTVCFNLQQTPQDGKMTLRLFGKSDDLLRMLVQELGLPRLACRPPAWPRSNRELVPYDKDGRRLAPGRGRRMWLDLRDGQKVRITPGHNIQGAQQPQYMHIGAPGPYRDSATGQVRQPAEGLGTVARRDDSSASYVLAIEGAHMRLGIWWLEAAARGGVEALPVVNQKPAFE